MVVRIEYDGGKHVSLYEGNCASIHRREKTEDDVAGVEVVVGGMNGQECITISLDGGNGTRVFTMNDRGKTIDSTYV